MLSTTRHAESMGSLETSQPLGGAGRIMGSEKTTVLPVGRDVH